MCSNRLRALYFSLLCCSSRQQWINWCWRRKFSFIKSKGIHKIYWLGLFFSLILFCFLHAFHKYLELLYFISLSVFALVFTFLLYSFARCCYSHIRSTLILSQCTKSLVCLFTLFCFCVYCAAFYSILSSCWSDFVFTKFLLFGWIGR